MADCVDKVLKAFPEADRKDVEALYNSMNSFRQKAFLDAAGNPNVQFREKVTGMLERYRNWVESERTKAVENVVKRRRAEAFADDKIFGGRAEGIRALIAGTFKRITGGRLSVDYRQKATANMLRTSLIKDLDNTPGLVEILKKGDLDLEIMQEVHSFSTGGKGGVSGSAQAKQIGEAIHKLNKARLKILNESGAAINDLEGYIMMQAHDAEEMKALGKDAWVEKILPLLDHEKTFNRDFYRHDPKEYLESVFDELTDGKPKAFQSDSSDQFVKIIGTPANMAKRLEVGRKLHFKSPEAFFEYNKDVGKKTLAEQVSQSITSTARSAGLMQVFGTNPRATFERMIDGLTEPEKKRLQNYWDEVSGATSIPGNSPLARYGAGIRMVNDMAKLGGSVVSSFGDLMTRAATMTVGGDNILSAHLGTFKSFIDSIPASQRQEALYLTSIGADSRLGELFSSVYAQDAKPGLLTRAHQNFFTLNGLRHWTDINKAATAQQLAGRLGFNAGKGFAALDAPLAKQLQGYGIGPVEWELIRQTAESADGVTMIGFGGIQNIPNDLVELTLFKGGMIPGGSSKAYIARRVQQFKSEMSTKLATYFNDQTAIAMNEAGARERAEVLRRGTIADSVDGQVMRFFSQFKSYPVTMVTKFWDVYSKQVIAERQGVVDKGMALAPLFVSSLILGYLSVSAKEMLKGKTPPDPMDPKTFMNAATRGGMLGIYGDFLMGEFDSRHGRSALSALVGPTFGQMDDLWDLKARLLEEDAPGGKSRAQKVASQAMRIVLNNTPGSNLPGVRLGADWLFLNEINETLNPGYAKRQQSKMEETGQTYLSEAFE